jgi:nucleoside-diphosphate-sugar epimerase
MNTVLITGAAGFVGGHVLHRLSNEPTMFAIAATRDGRGNSRKLDLRDPKAMQAALVGVTALVHCAVGDRSVTVDGTRALLRAAAKAGVRRFIHISSVAVYGLATGAVGEDAPLVSSASNDYAGWKAAAEAACLAEAGIETIRLRPTIVYGPGGTLWVSQMARRIRSGRWGVFGVGGEGTCNLIHVSDVASAVVAALNAPTAGGAFNVNGPEAITWNEWFCRLAADIGAPPLREISPRTLHARSLASLPLKALSRVKPGVAADWLLGAPASSELILFALAATYPTDTARAVLGWSPAVTIDEGLADSVAWLRQERLAA